MAAKNKIRGRGRSSIASEDSDLRDLMGLHFHARLRADEVEEQIQELRAAGKYREALVMRMHAEGIQQGLRAIEAEVQSAVRASRAGSTQAAGLESRDDPSVSGAQLLAPVRRSLGPDFEATVNAGITLKIPR